MLSLIELQWEGQVNAGRICMGEVLGGSDAGAKAGGRDVHTVTLGASSGSTGLLWECLRP
jgi:hypothetical protein